MSPEGRARRPRRERVIALGGHPLSQRAARVLTAGGVQVRRFERLPARGLPVGPETLLTADDAELPAALSAAAAVAAQRRGGLRLIVLSMRGTETDPPDLSESSTVASAVDPSTLPDVVPGVRVDWLYPHRIAARTLFARWHLHVGFDPLFGQRLHLVIAGFGALNRAIALHVMRIGQYADEPPVLTLIDSEPGRWARWIEARHPMAPVCARLRFCPPAAPGFDETPPVSLMVVGESLPEQVLSGARRLRAQAAEAGASPLILLALDDERPAGPMSAWDGQLVPLCPLDLALSPQVLLGGRDDRLAEVIHEHYRDTSFAQGRDPAAAPSGQPWAELATSYRDANRHQADHLSAKLALTDCRAVPEELVESFAFRPTEVERLAIVEHRRWSVERWLDGWRYGAVRDNAEKRHPQLIPYDDLSGPMKDLDRFAVRLLPALLARSGLGVVRRLMVAVRAAGKIDEGDADEVQPAWLRAAATEVLLRLSARYPDRGLTLALNLEDAFAGVVAALACSRFDAGLLILLPRPLPDMLADANAKKRLAMLDLLQRAERRIPLAGPAALEAWLRQRTSIECVLGVAATAGAKGSIGGGKRVLVDAQGRLTWTFEY